MSDLRDPAIKLFGKTIALPLADESPPISGAGANPPVEVDYDRDESLSPEKSVNRGGLDDELDKEQVTIQSPEDVTEPEATSGVNDNPKTPSIDNESATQTNSKSTEDQSETSGSQDKTPKKPDKILPCPRCNSMDTKFCYYNNYNVNQPRHFCKHCMRYWTAGGTMRNVPVGAGRRKNKNNSVSHFAIHNSRVDVPTLKTNGTVLAFGSDAPLCESMASVLNLAEKTGPRNGFHKPEEQRENCEDFSSGFSSITTSNIKDEPVIRSCNGYPPQVPCFPGAPWPYPMPSPQWTTPLPPPPFCPPTFPIAFYPPQPYWGYIPCVSLPNPSVPWSGGPNLPILGKHPRENGSVFKPINVAEDEPMEESTSERSLWVPKTLRIDDPGEAAKSSIWSTLGIKMDKGDSIGRGGLFKAFHSKGDEKNQIAETSRVLQANPAALSRSRNFHETS